MTQRTLEDTGSNPRGAKHTDCVSLSTNGSCGTTGCPHRHAVGGMVGTSCELLARAPGVLIAPAHRTCLVHRCPGLSRNA